jgi:hypothetical protein
MAFLNTDNASLERDLLDEVVVAPNIGNKPILIGIQGDQSSLPFRVIPTSITDPIRQN